jgi:hypothetical protein
MIARPYGDAPWPAMRLRGRRGLGMTLQRVDCRWGSPWGCTRVGHRASIAARLALAAQADLRATVDAIPPRNPDSYSSGYSDRPKRTKNGPGTRFRGRFAW